VCGFFLSEKSGAPGCRWKTVCKRPTPDRESWPSLIWCYYSGGLSRPFGIHNVAPAAMSEVVQSWRSSSSRKLGTTECTGSYPC
jgi:hypothetical protein